MSAHADVPGSAVFPRLPDPVLTPGVVASTSSREVCGKVNGRTYSRRHRVWRDEVGTVRKYGLPDGAMQSVEDDDLVPVSLGGANADPRNHWPQLKAPVMNASPAHKKDIKEDLAARRVCALFHSGDEPQADALLVFYQRWFMQDRWATDPLPAITPVPH